MTNKQCRFNMRVLFASRREEASARRDLIAFRQQRASGGWSLYAYTKSAQHSTTTNQVDTMIMTMAWEWTREPFANDSLVHSCAGCCLRKSDSTNDQWLWNKLWVHVSIDLANPGPQKDASDSECIVATMNKKKVATCCGQWNHCSGHSTPRCRH